MANLNWENFVESELINFLKEHQLESIMVSNDKNKATIKRTSTGEYKVDISVRKTL